MIGLVQADSKFLDERDDIAEYIRSLDVKAGKGRGGLMSVKDSPPPRVRFAGESLEDWLPNLEWPLEFRRKLTSENAMSWFERILLYAARVLNAYNMGASLQIPSTDGKPFKSRCELIRRLKGMTIIQNNAKGAEYVWHRHIRGARRTRHEACFSG